MMWRSTSLALAVSVALVAPAWAQRADLTGTALDQAGGALPGVAVTVAEIDQAVKRDTQTDADGAFTFPQLPPGRYELTASLPGFAPHEVKDIRLEPGQRLALTVQMQLTATEVVDVFGAAPSQGYRAVESVAATRLAVPVRDLPINVSIATAAFMNEAQVYDIIDVMRYKGINANRDIRFNSMFIRGFNNTLQKRNGVTRRYNWQTVNIDQVEVVKGPASILYGSVLPGGAVMSVSKKPERQAHLSGALSGGSFGFFRGSVDAGQPLDPQGNTAYRLIAEFQNSDDYYANTFVDRKLVNPTFRWQVAPRLRVDFEFEYVRHKEHQTNYMAYYNADSIASRPAYPANAERLPRFPATGFSWGFLPLPEKNHNSAPGNLIDLDTRWYETTVYAQLSKDWTARVLTNFNEARSRTFSATVSSLPFAGGQHADLQPAAGQSFFRDVTMIADMTGRHSFGGFTLVPLVGVDVFHGIERTYRHLNRPPLQVVRIDSVSTSDALLTMAEPVFSQVPDTVRDVRSVYGIGQLETLGGRVRLLGGLRYEEGETNPQQLGISPGNTFDALNTQFGIVYKPSALLTTFLNVSESFVPNTIVNPDGGLLPLEKGHGWELGLRTFLPGDRVVGTFTVYQTTRDQMARLDTGRTFDEIANPERLQYYTTSGEERVSGFETEIFTRVWRGWDLSFNYNWLPYAKVISFPDRPDIEGNRLRYAPTHGVSLWSRYEFDRLLNGVYTFGGVTYQSQTEWDADKAFTTIVFEPWANVDLGAGWRGQVGGHTVDIELLGKNLSDNVLTATYRPQDRRKLTLTTRFFF